jgi:hypothetical protein
MNGKILLRINKMSTDNKSINYLPKRTWNGSIFKKENVMKEEIKEKYCEWYQYSKDMYRNNHDTNSILSSVMLFEYKYCPYCGKKIKVIR